MQEIPIDPVIQVAGIEDIEDFSSLCLPMHGHIIRKFVPIWDDVSRIVFGEQAVIGKIVFVLLTIEHNCFVCTHKTKILLVDKTATFIGVGPGQLIVHHINQTGVGL